MKGTVKKIIDSINPISDQAFSEIEKLFELETYSKNETFIAKDKKNQKEYFVLKGVAKSYLINPEGDEVTLSFFMDSMVLSPYTTRTSGNISTLNFKALTDIELVSINAIAFQNLMIENLEIRNFANTVLENELMSKVEKEIGLASLTARERLLEFRKKFKMLENLIPHTDIASYLGITNISLSRLRGDLAR